MSVDECAGSDEALLLDALNGSVSASPACDDAFADLQADLDAFDALIAREGSLLLHLEAPPDECAASDEHVDVIDAVADCVSSDESCPDASSSSVDGDGDAAVSVTKKPRCAPGGNAARKRQRDEVHALRESAELLEKELQTLTTIAKRSSSQVYSSSGTVSPDLQEPKRWSSEQQQTQSPTGSLPSPPQTTSKQQLEEEKEARQISQLENNRLSKLVNDHARVARQFEKALFKRRLTISAEELGKLIPSSVRPARMGSEPRTSSDLLAFATLGNNIEAQYLDLERMFRAIGLADCRTNLIETRVDTDHDAGGATLKFKFSQLMPFSIQHVNELMAKNIAKRHGAHENRKKQFQVRDITVNKRDVAKRYFENGRVVMVWERLSEWHDKESGEVVSFREQGWSIMQPYQQSSSAKQKKKNSDVSSPLTLFQTYVCLMPVPTKIGTTTKKKTRMAHVAVLSDVVKPLYETQFVARIQDFENALLDDSLVWQGLAAS